MRTSMYVQVPEIASLVDAAARYLGTYMHSGALYMYFDGGCLSSKLRQQLVQQVRVPMEARTIRGLFVFSLPLQRFSQTSATSGRCLCFAVATKLLLQLPKYRPGIQFDCKDGGILGHARNGISWQAHVLLRRIFASGSPLNTQRTKARCSIRRIVILPIIICGKRDAGAVVFFFFFFFYPVGASSILLARIDASFVSGRKGPNGLYSWPQPSVTKGTRSSSRYAEFMPAMVPCLGDRQWMSLADLLGYSC
ncbi:hypothetical protein J3F84DRAFT_120629 [Trichoderma pleuroticola]